MKGLPAGEFVTSLGTATTGSRGLCLAKTAKAFRNIGEDNDILGMAE